MVRGGFERKVDENDEETYQFVLSNSKILEICGTKEFLLRRNINISAQAETYEFSVCCTVTKLIFK